MKSNGSCRICNGTLIETFDFGRQPLSDSFPADDTVAGEFFFRLAVGICTDCTMVQLTEEVPRERMFHEDYPYHSSGSVRMQQHFVDTAKQLVNEDLADSDGLFVEIGSNDGVLLKTIKSAGVRHLGIEPSVGVAELSRAAGCRVWTEFFDEELAERIVKSEGKATVVFSANTICHIPYLTSVLNGMRTLLEPGGVFVFEDPYFGDIIEKRSFDQIYDEHYFLFTARSVQEAASRHGLELVNVEPQAVHGGEVRYSLSLQGTRAVSPSVDEMLETEKAHGLGELDTLQTLGRGIDEICGALVKLLSNLKKDGRKVVAYGATAKSATLLNYAGIDRELIHSVYDSTPAKIGRLMPGTHIPIVDSAGFRDSDADIALLLAWNHAEEITSMEREFRQRGGKWVVYQPEVNFL